MNFFLFQFYYYSLEKDNAIQVSLKPLLFRYKMRIHCKCIQFIIYLLLVPISTVLQSSKRVFSDCNYIVQICEQDLTTFLCFYRAKQDNGYKVNEASNLHATNVLKARSFVLAC